MLIECKNCGAPLDVQQHSNYTRCRYCGRTQQIKTAHKTAIHTPANWHPPQQWIPPAQFAARSVPLNYDQTKTIGKFVLWIVILTTILPAVIFGVVMLVVALLAVVGASATTSRSSSTSNRAKPVKIDRRSASERSGDDAERAQSQPRGDSGGADLCTRAVSCCQKISAGHSEPCTKIPASSPQICQQLLDNFERSAASMGQSCR